MTVRVFSAWCEDCMVGVTTDPAGVAAWAGGHGADERQRRALERQLSSLLLRSCEVLDVAGHRLHVRRVDERTPGVHRVEVDPRPAGEDLHR